jgi:hypothetical protein
MAGPNWDAAETSLYEDMISHGPPSIEDDRTLELLFDTALFQTDLNPGDRDAILDELYNYLWDEYGLDFDEVFDWEGYREWYDAA